MRGEALVSARPDLSLLVRELRERLGLTQEKLAAKLGVTFPTVNRWENGRAEPSPLALQQIKELLKGMRRAGADLRRKFFPDNR